jgi:hypothetical protein
MEVELRSSWQDLQVELLKSIHGYEMIDFNDEIGSVDFVAEVGGEGRVLLRVVVNDDFGAAPADMKTVEKTLEELEGGSYDEAILMAERFTSASKEALLKEESLGYISPGSEHYSVTELLEAIEKLTRRLCEAKCGSFPTSAEECKGYVDGRYTCRVRLVSDDADFHAEMGWLHLLMKDFDKLVKLQREI